MTCDLIQLREWLLECKVTHVAMESTGVYWKPLFNLLEETSIDVKLVNARHVKNVPGRKTDVKDAEWLASLLQHGMLNGSYVPEREWRELRELVRYRRTLIQERADEVNRVQKVLEGANIKLASVATDVMGVSGRLMLEAMVQGVDDPEALAAMAKGKLRKKQSSLEKAMQGLMGNHQRMMLKSQLRHIEFLDGEIERLDCEINDRMKPYQKELEQLDQIPGIGERNSQELIAYIGVDMSRFPSAMHLASWAKVCPGNDSSAGKRRSGRTGRGNPCLRAALMEAAWAAIRKKGCFLAQLYHRIAARRGKKRAAVAVAHRILVIIFHVLKDGRDYREVGVDYMTPRQKEAAIRRAIKRLHELGVKVTPQVA